MLLCLISAALLGQSFAQTRINCSATSPYGTGYNSSYLMLVQNATYNGYPYPYSIYSSVFNNGTFVSYGQAVNGNPFEFDSGVSIPSNSDNDPHFDCYANITTKVPTQNTTYIYRACSGYSVITFGQSPFTSPFAMIGCYDLSSPECPSACTPEYLSTQNRTFFAQFYLGNIMDHTSAKTNFDDYVGTNQKFKRRQSSCDSVVGYNTTNILYNPDGVPGVTYNSLYSNGTVMMYDYSGKFFTSGKYNISQSASDNVDCNLIWTFDDIKPTVQCLSFSSDPSNVSAIVGCTSFNETCPTICSPDFVLRKGNSWVASLALNPVG